MPNFRIQYFRGPVWAKTKEQLKKQIVEGNNPINGKPVMKELVEILTKPLTEEEKKTGEYKRDKGPLTFTGTPDELQKLFLEKRFTDFMPVILPTEEKVAEMLKGTSHRPDEVLGRMNPGSEAGDTWTYTVKDAAVNAVMAGAKPEYFPVILALGSSGSPALNVSDNGFMAGAVINGRIRDEIGLNYEIGAVGPYAHANTAIGRAWNLLSINGGTAARSGRPTWGQWEMPTMRSPSSSPKTSGILHSSRTRCVADSKRDRTSSHCSPDGGSCPRPTGESTSGDRT